MEDISKLIEEFSKNLDKNDIPDNLKDVLNNFNNSTTSNNSNKTNYSTDDSTQNDTSSFNLNNLDINTFLKLNSIMSKMNSKDNPNAKLLLALKPYLKDDKQTKLDQYIQLLNMSSIIEIFKDTDGDKNDK